MPIRLAALITTLTALVLPARAEWYASVDFVAPVRGGSANTVFQRNQEEEVDQDGIPTGDFLIGSTNLLTASDVRLGIVSAGRVKTGYRNEIYGFEATCTLADEWSQAAAVQSTAPAGDLAGLMASPFAMPGSLVNPGSDVDSNHSASIVYVSKMSTGEIHGMRMVYSNDIGNAWLSFGARILALNESLEYASQSYTDSNTERVFTKNFLVGPQVGLLTESAVPGGLLNIDLKFALAYNWVEKTTVFNGTTGTGDDGTACAFGEFGIEYEFYPRPWLAIQLGYQLLVGTNVALATENFETNLPLLASGNATVSTDCVVYHSPFIGTTVVW